MQAFSERPPYLGFECVGLGSPRSRGVPRRGCLILNGEFLIGEGIAHAKPRQEYGVDPQRTRRRGSIIAAGSGEELLKLVVRTHLTRRISNTSLYKNAYRQQLSMKIIRITYTLNAFFILSVTFVDKELRAY